MKHMIHGVRPMLYLLLVVVLAGCLPAAKADSMQDALNAPVPFGIAHADDGSGLAVYQSASTRNKTTTLTDYQLCAILNTTTSGQKTWLRIRYLSGTRVLEGYIQETGFYQLTLSGFMTVMNDDASAAVAMKLAPTDGVYQFVIQTRQTAASTPTPQAKVTATPRMKTPTPRGRATATPSGRKRYVLNTVTMKFHLPGCGEVARTAEENKKTTVTTRESLIEQGYSPCQKCNP